MQCALLSWNTGPRPLFVPYYLAPTSSYCRYPSHVIAGILQPQENESETR
jgi:hypothetical protein